MILLALLLATLPLAAAEFSDGARWKRPLRPDVRGTLTIGPQGVAFRPLKKAARVLEWAVTDVQHLDRVSRSEIVIQSYADSTLRLGRDRRYRFVTDGPIPDEVHAGLSSRIGKPATDRVVIEPRDADVRIPAKHVRPLHGSEGTIYLSPEWIAYRTEARGQSRMWRLDRDVEAVWSSDPYRLEIHALAGSEAFLRRSQVYRFSLKAPLDPAYYAALRRKLYDLRSLRDGPGQWPAASPPLTGRQASGP